MGQSQMTNNQALHHLMNLLARIHRDGGHYTEKHGLVKSVNDADAVIAGLLIAGAAPPDPAATSTLKRVIGCARCGATHLDLPARTFSRPFSAGGDTWNRWAMCPATNEPIMICDTAEPEPHDPR